MESTDQEPPASFERQLSPQEERDVLINFMGNVYGETKKLDGNVIGASTTLSNNKSNEIRQHIEKLVSQPIISTTPVLPESLPVPSPIPEVSEPVVSHPPVSEPTLPPQVQVEQPTVDSDQLSFNFNVSEKDELFALINTALTKIDKLNKKVDALVDISLQITPVKKKSAPRKKSVKEKRET